MFIRPSEFGKGHWLFVCGLLKFYFFGAREEFVNCSPAVVLSFPGKLQEANSAREKNRGKMVPLIMYIVLCSGI
jgi:hypothetical protein